jgi:hypothetical protein
MSYLGVVSGFAITFTYSINVMYAMYSGGIVVFNVNWFGEMYLELMLLVGCMVLQVWNICQYYVQKKGV